MLRRLIKYFMKGDMTRRNVLMIEDRGVICGAGSYMNISYRLLSNTLSA